MKTKILLVLALAVVGVGVYLAGPAVVDAAGYINFKDLKNALRRGVAQRTFVFSARVTSGGTAVAEGTNGVVSVMEINGLSEADVTDSDPDMLPYPCKLEAIMVDPSADSTIECDCVTVVGEDQFGNYTTDTIGACATDGELAEAEINEGNRVFAKVTSLTADDCAGGTAAEDDIRVQCSGEIGLPAAITSEAAIIHFCIYDLSATDKLCFESGDITTDLDDESVETDGLIGGGSTILADGDTLNIEVVPPAGK